MPTAKHRVSISPDDRLYAALALLSRRRKQAVSMVTLELVQRALELEEDLYFSRVADERLAGKEKTIDHDDAWR